MPLVGCQAVLGRVHVAWIEEFASEACLALSV
jgi:hypothetical protein